MRSAFEFLHTHAAPHAERLDLDVVAPSEPSGYYSDDADAPAKQVEDEAVAAELPQTLAALLGAACANGRLQELTVGLTNVQVCLGLGESSAPALCPCHVRVLQPCG